MKKSPVLIEPWLEAFTAWGGIDANDLKDRIISVKLREANNLIKLNWNDELYTDLQLQNGLKPTDTIPVWRTVGRVLANDGWIKTWTLVCEKTTSGDMVQLLYADDGTIWINRGNGWVELRDRHSIFVTEAEYNALPSSKLTDGNCYIIVDSHPAHELLSYAELIALNDADAILEELNIDALWYFNKYMDEWHIGENLDPELLTPIYYYLQTSWWEREVVDGKGFMMEDWAEVWDFIV